MKRGEEIPDEIRQKIYDRDLRRCRLCGVTSAYTYSVHHIRYRSEGGTNDLNNLILLCGSGSNGCHLQVHSDKGLYQPLMLELIELPGVTGFALLRRKIRVATSDRPRGGGLQRSDRDRTVPRFTGEGRRPVQSARDREPKHRSSSPDGPGEVA